MFPTIFDRIYHQIDIRTKKFLAPLKRNKLKRTEFTIVSNNCWGGVCYEHYGLIKQSPTIGMYFYPDDYLKLISNVKHYFSTEMRIISAEESKHYAELERDNACMYYIGVIDDIEAVLVHYKNSDLAVEKWKRRCSRVNYDNLLFKFCQQNGCTETQLEMFDNMELPGNKFMFVTNSNYRYKCAVYYRGFEKKQQIDNDTFYWDRFLDVTKLLNGEGLYKR